MRCFIAFLPLITRKPSRFLLLGPFLIMNLVTDYQYQYDLGFQYSFGSGALLVYLAAINLADISYAPMFVCEKEETASQNPALIAEETEQPSDDTVSELTETKNAKADKKAKKDKKVKNSKKSKKEKALPADIGTAHTKLSSKKKFITNLTTIALIFSIFSSVFILTYRLPSQTTYISSLKDENRQKQIEVIEKTLAKIDRSKSVMAATPQFVTPLYDVDELYEHNYSLSITSQNIVTVKYFTEYVVVGAATAKNQAIINKYKLHGYKVIAEDKNVITLLQRTEKSPPVGPAQ